MENKFGVNDRVRIVIDTYGQGGLTGHISEVEGSDDIPQETPYKVRGFWYHANELVLIADADVIEYARHEAPATEAARAGEGDDSGYSELIDKLSGQIKRLERENEAQAARIRELEAALTSIVRSWELGIEMGLPDDNTVRSMVGIAKEALQATARTADGAAGGDA
jgi:hypothetical protein